MRGLTGMHALIFLAAFAAALGEAASREPIRPFESDAPVVPRNKIDELVSARLEELKIEPARLCSDEVFVRRAHLDVIGTLPTLEETEEFLADRSPDKREVLIDRLLRREEFADYWAMKWGDALRMKAEFPINLWPNAVQAYHRWVRTCIANNEPYDRMARRMLTASGSNFRVPPVNFYRAAQSREPKALAQAVALTFMGARADKWPEDRLAGMAVFFSRIEFKSTGEWKEEIVQFDALRIGRRGANVPTEAVLPDGSRAKWAAEADPREVFADWLIRPENPWFARHAVNRIWYWLMGRGIVHEPDDHRADNPPSNPALLAYLEKELVESDYDLKHIHRLILTSTTYQLSSIPRSDHPQAAAQFAYCPVRRLDAEVLVDALCQITGTTEEYSSQIPEPFTFVPEHQRSIALSDGSIGSSFLELFGRPPRDTGMASERNMRPSAAQRLHLLNSSHIRRKIEQGEGLRALAGRSRDPKETVDKLCLTILSRRPTAEESKALKEYADSGAASGRELLVDIAWALINTAEFQYRH